MIPTDFQGICVALADLNLDLTTDEISATVGQSGSRANMLRRSMRRYNHAQRASRQFGFVGVGCITFAEMRLATFKSRVTARISKAGF